MVLIEDLYQYLKTRFDGVMTNFDTDDRWFTLSNIATKIATECVDYGLAKYIDRSNVLPEYNHYAEMKNEFLYKKFILTSRKKNYLGLQVLKEGNRFPVPKIDIKGLMYKKSNVNSDIGSIVADVMENDIMRSDKINIRTIKNKLHKGAEEIRRVMRTEEGRRYYVNAKLSEPMTEFAKGEHRVKAVKLWNWLNLGDAITPPANFQTVAIDLKSNFELIEDKYPMVARELIHFLDVLNKEIVMDKIEITCEQLDIDITKIGLEDAETPKELAKVMNKLGSKLANEIKEHNKTYKRRKVPKLSKTAKLLKLEDLSKIAVPTMISKVPQIILDMVNYIPNYTQVDSLAAPVCKELHFMSMRNKDDRLQLPNVLSYYK